MKKHCLLTCQTIADALRAITFNHDPIRVKIDKRPLRGGEKAWHWVKKGAPIRLEIGAKELANKTVYVWVDGIKAIKIKWPCLSMIFAPKPATYSQKLQDRYYQEALERQQAMTTTIDNLDDFYAFFKKQTGFVAGYWVEDETLEAKIKQDLGVTVRCFSIGSS